MGTVAAMRWMLLVAVLLPASVRGAPPVADWLREAEEVRSAEPARLAELLVELDAASAFATPAQREQVAYLHAYADAYSGRYASALGVARNLVETSQDPDMRIRARALIVTIHGLTRHFAEGLRELEMLHDGLENARDSEVRRIGLFASGGLYWQVGQYALAMRDFNMFIEDTGPLSERDRCFATHLREEVRQASGSVADALPAVIDQCLAAGEPLIANMARLALARGMELGGDTAAAIALLRKWLPEMEATRYPRLVTDVHAALAEWLVEMGELDAAQRHAARAIAEARDDTALLPLTTAHRVLYEIAEARGDARTALHHYRLYAEADKAYLNDVKAREFAYQIVRRETQQQNQQIELLDQQNQVLVLRQQVSEQAAQNTRLLIALLLFLLASLAYWAWRVTRRHQSLRLLAEMAAACRSLCRRMDVLGRLGGEEFAILLPGCNAEAAARVAEQCRLRISSIDTTGCGHHFPLAASFGVTDTGLSGYVLSRLLSHADQALYRAKHGGRNLVCVYAGEPVRSKVPVHVAGDFASQPS